MIGGLATFSKHALIVAAAAGIAFAGAINNAAADAKFQSWIADFRGTALNSGVSASTFNRAFAGVTEIDPEVLQIGRASCRERVL